MTQQIKIKGRSLMSCGTCSTDGLLKFMYDALIVESLDTWMVINPCWKTLPNDGRGNTASFGEGGKSHVLGEVAVDVPVLLVLNDVLCIDGL